MNRRARIVRRLSEKRRRDGYEPTIAVVDEIHRLDWENIDPLLVKVIRDTRVAKSFYHG